MFFTKSVEMKMNNFLHYFFQSPKSDYLFGTRKNNDLSLDKTPSKPKRISVPSDPNKFSLREITKKMSISMPELFDEAVVKKSHPGWSNSVENNLSVQKKNHSVDSLQVIFKNSFFSDWYSY